MSPPLSILCVSSFGAHAAPFIERLAQNADTLDARLVIGADGPPPPWLPADAQIVPLASAGYIESVLDEALTECQQGYILRIDDDEQLSPHMLHWLAAGNYLQGEHWTFPRMHLWPDQEHYITNAPLWPDLQTRLSLRHLAGERRRVHQGSPYGTGQLAPAPIEHHKFLVRPLAERERLLEHYESIQTGAGGEQFDMFSVPERYAERWVTQPVW